LSTSWTSTAVERSSASTTTGKIVDEGWIRCIGSSHGGELDSGHVPIEYYLPERVVSVDVYEKPSRKSV